eukprot:TRINITY_DN2200_c0_g1_i1.p1 TRINITY_DN2200_c0_g1~~TRINITY_DN2200_c0_g1_i1.p1  ORF type:complete len:322 (-),score=37.57 TRINITY_DN2200_c0_g1_i1:34-999(-)
MSNLSFPNVSCSFGKQLNDTDVLGSGLFGDSLPRSSVVAANGGQAAESTIDNTPLVASTDCDNVDERTAARSARASRPSRRVSTPVETQGASRSTASKPVRQAAKKRRITRKTKTSRACTQCRAGHAKCVRKEDGAACCLCTARGIKCSLQSAAEPADGTPLDDVNTPWIHVDYLPNSNRLKETNLTVVKDVNQAFCDLSGRSKEDFIGKPTPSDIVRPIGAQQQQLRDAIVEMRAPRGVVSVDIKSMFAINCQDGWRLGDATIRVMNFDPSARVTQSLRFYVTKFGELLTEVPKPFKHHRDNDGEEKSRQSGGKPEPQLE